MDQQRKYVKSQILTSAFEQLSLATTMSVITKTVAEAARALTGAEGTTFVLREDDCCYYVDENAISPLWKGKKFPAESCISGWSMIHGQVVLIPDIYQDDRIPHDAYRPTFVKSLCMVPIRPESALGAIGSYWAAEHTPSGEDIKVLQILANSTAVALENLELKRAIYTENTKSLELKEQAKELEAAMYSLGHDLRTPVAAMTSMAELVRMSLGPRLDPKTADFVRSIIETGQRAAGQIEKMLSLYRATNGQLEKKEVDLSRLAKETLDEVRLQFPTRVLSVKIQDDLVAMADQRLLQLVLENLLSNAIKYSSRRSLSKIEIGAAEAESGFRAFFVRDNGDGFESSEAHKLFKPLARLHSADDFAGTGLGLVSVAKIIELHGGRVWAEGRKNEGAAFYFALPQ